MKWKGDWISPHSAWVGSESPVAERDYYPSRHPVRFSRLTFSVVVTERLLRTHSKAVLLWPSLERSVNVLLPIPNIISQMTPNRRWLFLSSGDISFWTPHVYRRGSCWNGHAHVLAIRSSNFLSLATWCILKVKGGSDYKKLRLQFNKDVNCTDRKWRLSFRRKHCRAFSNSEV